MRVSFKNIDYFDDVFISFLDKDSTIHTFSIEGEKALGLNLKCHKLCFENEQRS